jgi:chlorite dismutase
VEATESSIAKPRKTKNSFFMPQSAGPIEKSQKRYDRDMSAPTSIVELNPVPLTLEGSSVLHQMFRVRWPAWHSLEDGPRRRILDDAIPVLQEMEKNQSAIFSLLGHKGDLMVMHYRESFDELNRAELHLARTKLFDFLEQTTSYLSVVELGLYKSSVSLYKSLAERNVTPFSDAWNAEIEDTLQRQREAMRPRLYPAIPDNRYVSFYPMNRRRGEDKNWYRLHITERARQMEDHGNIGQRYAGKVKQIISGSVGFDDWEWGVDLFADDPVVFKKLIYEMRFDEVSAAYSDFGTFYIGVRCPIADLPLLLSGELRRIENSA